MSNTEAEPEAQTENPAVKWGVSIAILAFSVLVCYLLVVIRKPPPQKNENEPAPLVNTTTVTPYKEKLELQTTGLVVPYREINISAEVAGRITFKSDLCKAGIFVKAGTKLLEIDSEEHQLEVDRATAELSQANNQLIEIDQEISGETQLLANSKQEEAIQKNEYERLKKLKNVVSQSELNQAERAYVAAQAAVVRETSQLQLLRKRRDRVVSGQELAKTKLAQSKLNLSRAIIKAPSNGIIAVESVEKMDFVQRGEPLIEFEDTSAAEVRINLRPDELQRILDSVPAKPKSTDSTQEPFNPFAIPELDAKVVYEFKGAKSVWQGKLSRFETAGLNESTRTIPCRIKIENRVSADGRTLVRGMFVQNRIALKSKIRLLQVPAKAVSLGNVVWTAADNSLKRHVIDLVSIEKKGDSELFVFLDSDDAPKAGERVVVSPLVKPVDGMEVRTESATKLEVQPVSNQGNGSEGK